MNSSNNVDNGQQGMDNDRRPASVAVAEWVAAILSLSYVIGFVLWNSFLGHYGYFEFDFLQTRFVSAGLAFLLPIVTIILLLITFGKQPLIWSRKKVLVSVYVAIVYFLIYAFAVFPLLPQALGGARPFAVTLLGNSEQISYLNMFNLQAIPGSAVQTVPICEIYSNSTVIIIGALSFDGQLQSGKAPIPIGARVMILHQSELKGTQPVEVSKEAEIHKITCDSFIY